MKKNSKFKIQDSKLEALRLEAMALEIPDWPEHPNRVPFSGVLTRVDSASDRSPAGAAGHRVLLPRTVAEHALPSLLGMAVDYAPGLRGHDVRRKIGVITRAEIASDRLEVSGYLYAKDFPEVLRELRARRERLGMSYEVTSVRVRNPAADVWEAGERSLHRRGDSGAQCGGIRSDIAGRAAFTSLSQFRRRNHESENGTDFGVAGAIQPAACG